MTNQQWSPAALAHELFTAAQLAPADSQPVPVRDYPPLPDFETVEQHIYGACRRYITQDMLEPIHNLIRDVIDADRAARAPADSQPAPEYVGNGMFKGETIQKAAEHWANWCDVRCMTGLSEFLRVVAARPPADSVLEDAARLDWLALAGPTSICLVIDRPHDGEIEVATDDVIGYGKTLREALDAARKQGGA